jgi:hypothetical protein
MESLKINQNPEVELKFQTYPDEIKAKLDYLRNLIIETASENETIKEIEETLKWGEPSYLVKKGSTIRIDWKSKTPNQYAMYFKCTSKLVPTFREVYGNLFKYENNRAILFNINDEIPKKELKECIALALTYHLIKNKPLLGIVSNQFLKAMNTYKTNGKVEIFPQKGGWVYIRIPFTITKGLLHRADRGLIPIKATVGESSWNTSLLPKGDGTHFIALNAKIRKKEGIKVGNYLSISFETR